MEYINSKTILNRVKFGDEWFGLDYNFNLYRGCPHGCIYCDSRNDYYGIENFDTIHVKRNCLEILEHELAHKRKKGVVGIGAMSDAYNPAEEKLKLTRSALELLSRYNFGISIETKSSLIVRDIDIMQEINEKNNVIMKMTITTPNDDIARAIEPHVCVSSERFRAVREMVNAGIFAGVIMDPILPFITDGEEDIRELVRLGAESGAKFIYCHFMGVTLRDNQRIYFYEQLDKRFPGLKEKYVLTYGNKSTCRPTNHKELRKIFEAECERLGIIYKMPDIIKTYKRF